MYLYVNQGSYNNTYFLLWIMVKKFKTVTLNTKYINVIEN